MTERSISAARVLELAEELEAEAAAMTERLSTFEWAKDQARAGCLGGGSSMLNEAARCLRALVERSGKANAVAPASPEPGSPAATDRLIDALRALATAHGYELVDYAVRASHERRGDSAAALSDRVRCGQFQHGHEERCGAAMDNATSEAVIKPDP